VERDTSKSDYDLIKFKADEAKGWRNGDQESANNDYKKSEHALNEAH